MPDKEPLLDRARQRMARDNPASGQAARDFAELASERPDPAVWPSGITPRMLITPHERDPVVFIPREQQEALLFASLDGVRLGEWDKRIVRWLAGLDGSTVLPLVAMIRRSRAVGGGEGWAAALEQDGG
jgi:hypothetical protein